MNICEMCPHTVWTLLKGHKYHIYKIKIIPQLTKDTSIEGHNPGKIWENLAKHPAYLIFLLVIEVPPLFSKQNFTGELYLSCLETIIELSAILDISQGVTIFLEISILLCLKTLA